MEFLNISVHKNNMNNIMILIKKYSLNLILKNNYKYLENFLTRTCTRNLICDYFRIYKLLVEPPDIAL